MAVAAIAAPSQQAATVSLTCEELQNQKIKPKGFLIYKAKIILDIRTKPSKENRLANHFSNSLAKCKLGQNRGPPKKKFWQQKMQKNLNNKNRSQGVLFRFITG